MTLQGGQAARCTSLNKGELYVALLYNSSQHDQTAEVFVTWSNKIPPKQVSVPGTTGTAGPAQMVFVSGSDADYLTLSLGSTSTAAVDIVLVSQSMPANSNGIHNIGLPADGAMRNFPKYTRYHAQLKQGWQGLAIVNSVTAFTCVQMRRHRGLVITVNTTGSSIDERIHKFGKIANKDGIVTTATETDQQYNNNALQGNDQTIVWMNADSEANGQNAQISLQMLSVAKALLATSLNYAASFLDAVPSAFRKQSSPNRDD